MKITKIVLTGGPCAGKTTAMRRIQSSFTKMGYTVLFVPEAEMERSAGHAASDDVEYWKRLMKLQLEKEKALEQAAAAMPGGKALIVCGRGALDNKAYMSQQDFACVLDAQGSNEVELRDGYDAVFHLVTAAKGAEQFYTNANKAARTESVEQAAALDDRLIAAWTGHPHLRVIGNAPEFEEKLKRLMAEISVFLGEPEPYEMERKFLIEYPDIAWLEKLPTCQRVEIVQTYLRAEEGEESRVRQRGIDGHYIYVQTTKRRVSELKRVEVERRMTREEYLKLLMDADPACRPIRKTRYCLTYENQYFEIDVYPFWQDKAIVEIELLSEEEAVRFPPQLRVIREVTKEPGFKNAALAKNMI